MKAILVVSVEISSQHTAIFHRAQGLVRPAQAILCLLLLMLMLCSTARAADLTDGFTETQVTGGLANPVAMEFAPDGRLFVSEQAGRVRVVKNGVLLATPFVDLTNQVDSAGERGVVGIAFDPNFASNRYVYIYYTAKTPVPHNRVSRFTASGDVAIAGSEVVIFELNNLSASMFHNGGAIHFGLDGKLYVATGDSNVSDNADSFQNLLGKILRINADGSIPADNPFYNSTSGNNRAIWALGLRNPYMFAVQPGTGRIFINDVGEDDWEEINDGIAGSHYGWPNTEGPTSNPSYRSPIFAYPHGTSPSSGCAITGGTFYNPPNVQFPNFYTGSYFFADYCSGWIRRLDPSSNNVTTFASDIIAPVDLKVGPDGSLYYLGRGTGSTTGVVFKITYNGTQPTPPPQSGDVYLSDLPWVSATNGWGPVELDQSNGENGGGDGNTITLDGVTYSKGLGAHAVSEIIYNLGGNYTSFSADVGVDDEVSSNGSVTFEVWADGVKLYDSGLLLGSSARKSLNVSVAGRQQLRLVVTDGGDGNTSDHADWAGARVSNNPNQAPSITQQPASQTVLQTQPVTFSVVAAGTSPITYQWQRNGVNINGATSSSYTLPSASLSDNGARFRVILNNSFGTVTSSEAILTVSANRSPAATILTPQEGSFYSGGEGIGFSGTATDPEDGLLPESAFTWEIVFHHGTHTHPFLGPFTGDDSGGFGIPTLGETSTNVWYRIYLTVKDSAGATTTVFRDIFPRKSTMTFVTSPPGLQIALDGQPRTTPFSVEGVVGMERTLGVISPQTINGTTYVFSGWSEGGGAIISTPPSNTTYTAFFTAQAAQTVTDDFNDNSRNTNLWNLGTLNEPAASFDSQVVVAEKNQRLEIAPRQSVSGHHYNGYVSVGPWNLTGGTTSVEVLQTAKSGASTIFAIGIDSNNWYRFVVEDGQLYFQNKRAGFKFSESTTYNATTQRFWRFRHDVLGDKINFEISPDGTTWTIMRSIPRDLSITTLRAELSAGTFGGVFDPGTAIFDNFRLETLNSAPSTSTTVGFSTSQYTATEYLGSEALITVNRVGDTTTAFTVDYSTSDLAGLTPCQINTSTAASERCDYATTAGTLRFAPGETTKTIRIPIVDDFYVEENETFSISLRNPQGANLNFLSTSTILIGGSGFLDNDMPNPPYNPIDRQDFFIYQQYVDFLGRLPDPDGFSFWNNRMSDCPAGQICDRIDTSQRFFQSDEFNERGFYVYRLYDAVLGRLPLYREFMPDVGRLSGLQTVAEQRQSKDAYLLGFINRTEFRSLYGQYLSADGLTAINPAGFVDALSARAGITPASRQTLINNLQSGARTPAQTVEDFILKPELSAIGTKFYDRGFITMQYFGYLRRDPDAGGFNFWVGQLMGPNAPHRLDYRFMVGGFLQSDEYRFRFARISAP